LDTGLVQAKKNFHNAVTSCAVKKYMLFSKKKVQKI
jgi:hypothetical protein